MQKKMITIHAKVKINMSNLNNKKVLLGLSGGVDSTAAALLLKNQGYAVSGLFFDINENKSENAYLAEKTANELGIEYIYKNLYNEFSNIVIKNFCVEYSLGRTPNPCALCNPMVKFKTLIEEANNIGAYHIATGHYAGIHLDSNNGIYYLKRAKNLKKDQSYMLYRLNQDVLSRIIFPLNEVEDKETTRNIVRDKKINNSERKDSQEICFVKPDDSYIDFLNERGYKGKPGKFIDTEGNYLGEHKGIENYTVGQRKGLGTTFGKPMYVIMVNHNNNTVTLGTNDDLYKKSIFSMDNVFPFYSEIVDGLQIEGKIRYSSKLSEAQIFVKDNGIIETVFMEKQRAATPGQSIVFYKNDLVIGGGIIIWQMLVL